MLVGLDLPSAGGGIEAGIRSPHRGNCLRGETFKAESETDDLLQAKLNEKTVLATAMHTPDREVDLLEGAAAGSWTLGIVEQPQGRAAVNCGETDQGDVREEIVVGNACGRKPGSHGSKGILLSHV